MIDISRDFIRSISHILWYLADLDGVVDRSKERDKLGASENAVAGNDDLEAGRDKWRQ